MHTEIAGSWNVYIKKKRKWHYFIYLPVDPEKWDGEASEEKVDSEERSKNELPFWLWDLSIQKNMVFCHRVEETQEGKNNANNSEPN